MINILICLKVKEDIGNSLLYIFLKKDFIDCSYLVCIWYDMCLY